MLIQFPLQYEGTLGPRDRGREFPAHCKHSRKTEIRILNRTENRVFSSKPRLWLRVENGHTKCRNTSFRSAFLAWRESSYSLVGNATGHITQPGPAAGRGRFHYGDLLLQIFPLNSWEIIGQECRNCEDWEQHGWMGLQLHATFCICNLCPWLCSSISPGMNLNWTQF